MITDQIHRTINSLTKKHYTIETYSENHHCIIYSFYHLNSVYNGLLYIGKESDYIKIDFQYHNKNKTIEKQLTTLAKNIKKLYNLNQLETVTSIVEYYQPIAKEIYNKNYSLKWGA